MIASTPSRRLPQDRPSPRSPLRRLPRPYRTLMLLSLLLFSVAFMGIAAMQWDIRTSTKPYLYASVEDAPSRPVALVFGAGIVSGREPSVVLRDRLLTAIELYKAGKVKKLLVTGDNGSLDYNEVAVMRRFALRHGVPGHAVVKDHAGFRTYDSCYRARDVFEVRSAILVTQAFHLPRAVYLARKMGIDAVGVAADRRTYLNSDRYQLREWPASAFAWVQVNITHPRPRYLGPRIPVLEDARQPT